MLANNQEQTITAQAIDRLVAMRHQEERSYKCTDYLAYVANNCGGDLNTSKIVNAECRLKMLQWCTQVADFCKFDSETVCIAMTHMDRFLSTEQGGPFLLDRKDFQLVAICAFYIAVKLSEPRELDISLLSEISKGAYSTDRIAQMEREMLTALNWRMHPPTALSFTHCALEMLPSSVLKPSIKEAIIDHAQHQSNIAVSDYTLIMYSKSTVAVASLLNTLEVVDDGYFPIAARRQFLLEVMNVLQIDVNDRALQNIKDRLNMVSVTRDMKPSSPPTASPNKTKSNKRPRSPVSVCRKA
mmetsp:Transcript_12483/g.15653  ORF Transcript_12483/g.15653 Transcript_12483/m.15653 type:complete len:299 (+) Transcript_12483:65-961(+)|eukprot:CAMPEP_0172504484 /NCGR_PEP_ID=MMETSP1066-20121228/179054_1 /TAXON_ID=671091 /ORGANISM="Coscinodiscus wailesii, Strain CCMP2513" /LENGTH=298 /DNA_ID=CAMNT_0013280681 /DNA_START=65 /DNA_END=961 /DNA_ORIENTATION=-